MDDRDNRDNIKYINSNFFFINIKWRGTNIQPIMYLNVTYVGNLCIQYTANFNHLYSKLKFIIMVDKKRAKIQPKTKKIG